MITDGPITVPMVRGSELTYHCIPESMGYVRVDISLSALRRAVHGTFPKACEI